MDQFEETVVNPNISLNNFEVRVPKHDEKHVQHNTAVHNVPTKQTKKNFKAIFLLVLLSLVLIYQVTVVL